MGGFFRSGGITGADRIGQPAVSKAIAQIEERLGVRLLLRTAHGLSPTESGQNFYEHAKRVLQEAAFIALPQDVQEIAWNYPEPFFAETVHAIGRPRPDRDRLAEAVALLKKP